MHPILCHCLSLLALTLFAGCSGEVIRDHGPAPDADHQATVRAAMDRAFDKMNRIGQPSDYRFAAPVQDRVARWHFDQVPEGQPHQFGYVYGWRVDFWVTPHYAGYPPQPESHRMAFFADGQMRGLFSAGLRNAPLELDQWSPDWLDQGWQPGAGKPAAMR